MLAGFYLPTACVWNLNSFRGEESGALVNSHEGKTCNTALVCIIFYFIPSLPLSALQKIIDPGLRLYFENMHY